VKELMNEFALSDHRCLRIFAERKEWNAAGCRVPASPERIV